MRLYILVALVCAVSPNAFAGEFQIKSKPYFESGVFYRPLIPTEGEEVTFTIRATIGGKLDEALPASFKLFDRDGDIALSETLSLSPKGATADAALEWKAGKNGLYRAEVVLDPKHEIEQVNREDDSASTLVPVVVRGRKLYFPWFHERPRLRWANIWAGGFKKENLQKWLERGVLPLRWKWGTNLPPKNGQPNTVDRFYKHYLDAGGCPGIAIDELGYYPTPSGIEKFNTALEGLAKAKKEKPKQFVLAWHSGSLYPQQAALYRSAADLVVIESYAFYYAPRGLKTENIYDFLDMKMLPVRQVDAFAGPPASQATMITSVDLVPESFDRGEIEQVVRHLRRRWPEMRGFGVFGTLAKKDRQVPPDYANERFVDQLCYKYFIGPVVTFLPQSVWVTREETATFVTAAISNIGGMDAGAVKLRFLDNGDPLGEISAQSVPAGDSRLTNRSLVRMRWKPTHGQHALEACIVEVSGAKVLDGACRTRYYWQQPE